LFNDQIQNHNKLQMSIYSSTTAWTAQCSTSEQSPINLSQSTAKPCDLLCELVFDDAYISQANVIISDEGMVLQSTPGLGSCKFNGEGYTCQMLLLTHPSHHTIENIQADAEVVAIFTNPTGKYLCVSSLVRVNPTQTPSSHFFNAFVNYGNPSVESTVVNLGESWGLFMMAPISGEYFVYDGSLVVPPCQSAKWVVFKSMINIDSNDFAVLVKNVQPGSRPIQSLGTREVYFNASEQLSGGPMPMDNKTYMRCKRASKPTDGVKDVRNAPLGDTKKKADSKKPSAIHAWAARQIEVNGLMALIDVCLLIGALVAGFYYGKMSAETYPKYCFYLITTGQYIGAQIRHFGGYLKSFVFKKAAPVYTSSSVT
jgi:carbonic anhydrase